MELCIDKVVEIAKSSLRQGTGDGTAAEQTCSQVGINMLYPCSAGVSAARPVLLELLKLVLIAIILIVGQ